MNLDRPFLEKYIIPERAESSHCIFEPLTPDHLFLDYDAVMSSREFLRLWSNSDWPTDDFQLQENLEDLRNHQKEHINRIAYTYTILNPDKNQCLGCIYVNPINRITPVTREESILLHQRPAYVRFWVRESIRNTDNENIIMKAIIYWFKVNWKMNDILFGNNKKVPSQINLFRKNGLILFLELQQSSRHELLWRIN